MDIVMNPFSPTFMFASLVLIFGLILPIVGAISWVKGQRIPGAIATILGIGIITPAIIAINSTDPSPSRNLTAVALENHYEVELKQDILALPQEGGASIPITFSPEGKDEVYDGLLMREGDKIFLLWGGDYFSGNEYQQDEDLVAPSFDLP